MTVRTLKNLVRSLIHAALCCGALATCAAEEELDNPPAHGGNRRAIIVCGLPGDAEHRQVFGDLVEKFYAALTTRLGFLPEHTLVLFSDETTEKDGPALRASRGPATREKLAETVEELVASLEPDDAMWVFVLGHTHFDGRFSWLNLPGPDVNQAEFSRLFAAAACREQVFFMTTPASGFFIKPLAAPGRIVIAATEADAEVNETLFPHKLAAALASPPPMAEFDVDGDGQPTLLDVYLWSARETAQDYSSNELLATEHALLDDDGDGRGSEVQLDYLSQELGGRLRAGRKPTPRPGDGARARAIPLPMPAEASPPEQPPAESP
ncbi:MAG: hypothetical protein ACREHD_27150 [Pirellulales bacterium]